MKRVLNNIKKVIRNRSLIGAFVFAMALWGYSSLNEIYHSYVNVPLVVELPADRALESPLPESVEVKVEGNGWTLFNLNFMKSNASCNINLKTETIYDSVYRISRSEIITGISGLSKYEPRDVEPDHLELITGKVIENEVPIIPDVTIIPQDNYILVGEYQVSPPSVDIQGNEKIVKKIKSFSTESTKIDNVNSDIKLTLKLKDTLSGIVKTKFEEVEFTAKIEQMAEIIFENIPIVIKGGKLGNYQNLFPIHTNVIIRGGVHEIIKLKKERIMAYVKYNELVTDTKGVLKVYVDLPDNFQLLKSEPEYIYHYIEREAKSTATF